MLTHSQRDFLTPLPTDLTHEWHGRTFALIQFAVAREARGRGIGARLLRRLFATRREERAVLSVQPTAVRTQQIYDHLGWRRVGRKGPLAGAITPYWDIFVLDLRRRRLV